MCGFVGYVRLGDEQQAPLGEHLGPMSALLQHRGPDHAGVVDDGRCGLAHRRLSIIDPSPAGHQPMSTGPIQLVTNGEIYNFRSLAQRHGLNSILKSRITFVSTVAKVRWAFEEASVSGLLVMALWSISLHIFTDKLAVKFTGYT